MTIILTDSDNLVHVNKAPLVVPDKNDLGDLRLSPAEGVAKLKEGNQKLTDKKKIPNQSLLEDVDQAFGTPMHYSELIRRIKKINPAIIIEDGGIQGAAAVRHYCWDPYGGNDTLGAYGKKYVTGFYKEILPEFSSITTDKKGLPHREIRGWRSVLLALMKSGAVTFEQLKKEFGNPVGQRSVLWDEQTQEQRA